MSPSAPNLRPRRPQPLVLASALALLAGLAVSGFFVLRRPAAAGASLEVPREALVLRAGQLYLTNAAAPFTGQLIERYPEGGLRARSAIRNGRLEGKSEGWFTNSQPQVVEYFVAGVSHGPRTKWYPNGNKQSEAAIVAGKLQGVFRRWHPDGGLAEEISMNDGQPDGVSRSYYPSGYLKAQAQLQKGQVVKQESWSEQEQIPPPASDSGTALAEKASPTPP